ncbi:hypothetical protein TNCT_281071 [Trichonephila clavata]|uniref:Uncharacterized protein n=1 Tax=Trichonephila clavata TaxID=2740835 RepID=A0A8X6KN94_TRICU|nr:hypothetical protein TNCT_281071 [Trichonephila clavata]
MKNNKFGKRFGASLRVGGLTTMCWEEENPFLFSENQFGGASPRFSHQQWPRESPPLCNAGPHPGTTWTCKAGEIIHQLIERSQDMLVRLTRAPVLSGGLRRKTQLFSGTLYMDASSKTPPHQSKGPQKFKTSLQVPVFPGSSLLCCHTSCEKPIRHNFIPLSPGLPQDTIVSKIKDNM